MKYRLNYIVNIWLTSAVLGVVFFGAFHYLSFLDVPSQPSNIQFGIYVFGLTILLSSFFTAPVALCLLAYLNFLVRKSLTCRTIKQLLAIASFGLCTLVLAVFSFFFREPSLLLLLIISCYALPLIGSVFFYKLRSH